MWSCRQNRHITRNRKYSFIYESELQKKHVVKIRTAPSRTLSDLSTSTVKSTWPGVSIMLTWWSFHSTWVAADWMVIPRSLSRSIESIVAPTLSFPFTLEQYKTIHIRVGGNTRKNLNIYFFNFFLQILINWKQNCWQPLGSVPFKEHFPSYTKWLKV